MKGGEILKNKIFKKVYASIAGFVLLMMTIVSVENYSLPENFYVLKGEKIEFNSEVISINQNNIISASVNSGGITSKTSYELFGFIPIKNVSVTEAEEQKVDVCGCLFGIKMLSDGAIVVDVTGVETDGGYATPAKDAGIETGDIIKSVNGVQIKGNSDFVNEINKSGENAAQLVVLRDGKEMNLTITPAKNASDGTYKTGMWVKDSTAGIGTLTFIENDGVFAGLGHGITDNESKVLIPIESGDIEGVTLLGFTKAQSGKAGQLQGYFSSNGAIGEAKSNLETGVYGKLFENSGFNGTETPVAFKQEVKKGPAQILATIDSSGPQLYDIEIEDINYSDSRLTKNLQIRVTDQNLLQKTGGIIQGMSGSPILQNGKLVGAVTHVFLNDPERGYGIFAETMVEEAKKVS